MSDYRGTAWVLGPDNAVLAVVDAILWCTEQRPGGLKMWGGSLDGPADWFGLMEAGEAVQLKVGDRIGAFLVSRHDVRRAIATITGTGPAPFD